VTANIKTHRIYLTSTLEDSRLPKGAPRVELRIKGKESPKSTNFFF